MIPISQTLSNSLQRSAGHGTAQIHGDLAGINNLFVPFFRGNISRSDAEVLGNHLDNQFRRNFSGSAW